MMSRLTEGETDGTRAVIPQQGVEDGYEMVIDALHFVILAPPKAHSDTDIMIQVKEESVVFLGDNVLAKRLPRMDDASFRGNIHACDRAIQLNAKHYIPGHGVSGGSEVVTDFRDYLSIVYREVAKLYAQGLSDFEMKPRILPRLKAFHDWVDFDLEVGKHISLAMLEVEGAEFE